MAEHPGRQSARYRRNQLILLYLRDGPILGTVLAYDAPTRIPRTLMETAMGLKPIGDRIIVRRQAAEEKTSGGIILPDTAKNKPQRGEVIAVGPGKVNK